MRRVMHDPPFSCVVIGLTEPKWLQGNKPMAGLYPRGSKKWIEALDHAPENRSWVKKQRLEMLEADEQKRIENEQKNVRKQQSKNAWPRNGSSSRK